MSSSVPAGGMPRLRRPVIWSPEADDDLLDIWSYLTNEASEAVADRLVGKIHARAEALGRFPMTGRVRNELIPGIRSVLVQPYVIFYHVTDAAVGVARVLHGSRDLNAIFSDEGTT
jgi:toxin ParE1/3/4